MKLQSFFQFEFQAKPGVVRELREQDLPALIAYWHESSPAFLLTMGVDLNKLASKEKTEEKFRTALPGDGPRKHVAIVVEVAGRMVAYSNAYVDEQRTGHPHVHILDPQLRRHGLAAQLFARVLRIYFEHYGLKKLVLQTNPENVGVNAMLQSFGLTPRSIHDDNPSGMARAGLFNIYEIRPDDQPKHS